MGPTGAAELGTPHTHTCTLTPALTPTHLPVTNVPRATSAQQVGSGQISSVQKPRARCHLFQMQDAALVMTPGPEDLLWPPAPVLVGLVASSPVLCSSRSGPLASASGPLHSLLSVPEPFFLQVGACLTLDLIPGLQKLHLHRHLAENPTLQTSPGLALCLPLLLRFSPSSI